MKLFSPFLLVTVTLGLPISAFAQPEGENIVIGKSVEMHSKIYDKNIRLSVVLPRDYAESDEKYPVLFSVQTYFLHIAGSVEHLSRGPTPKMIYVHVETYDSGDLIPFQTARDLAEKQSVSDLTRFDDHIERVQEKIQKP